MNETGSAVWKALQEEIRTEMSPKQFVVWIKPLRVLQASEGMLLLGCPNTFSMEWVRAHYGEILEQKLAELSCGRTKLDFTTDGPGGQVIPPALSREQAFYVRALRSTECRCGNAKKSGHSFCYRCFYRLPYEFQKTLYKPVGRGYEEAYEQSVAHLDSHEDDREEESRYQ